MKIKQLLITASLFALFALAGCEAQKPLAEEAVAPVVVEAPVAAPVVVAEPALEAPKADYDHCKKHHGKKDKDCAKHCDHDSSGALSCPKHMSKHHGKKAKACVIHCSKESAAATK